MAKPIPAVEPVTSAFLFVSASPSVAPLLFMVEVGKSNNRAHSPLGDPSNAWSMLNPAT